MDFGEAGHICCYGATMSGKTHYIKELIKGELVKGIKKENVFVFTGSQDDGWEYSTFTWEQRDQVIDKIKYGLNAQGRVLEKSIIVLDDMNDIINTRQDKKYISLFTKSRHWGTRVITVGHQPTAVGPEVRESIRYGVIFNTTNIDILRKLSEQYLMGDVDKMKMMIKGIDQQYKALILDREGKFVYHKMETAKDINIGNRVNYGNDSSLNNYNVNIEQKDRVTNNTLNHQINIANYHHEREMNKLKNNDDLVTLLCKSTRSLEDNQKIIYYLNLLGNTNIIHEGNRVAYEKKYCEQKNIRYRASQPRLQDAASRYLVSGEAPINIAYDMISHFF